jgi:hypothetical protein
MKGAGGGRLGLVAPSLRRQGADAARSYSAAE